MDYFRKEVCEQLAHELVTEQAELLKHEALVDQIKAKLVEGKQQLIKHLIVGREFYLGGKKRTALHVDFYSMNGKMQVCVTMGIAPEIYNTGKRLTRKEKMLLEDYKYFLLFCKDEFNNNYGQDAVDVAKELKLLKNGIDLTYVTCWEIDFSNAATPSFFEQSGLEVNREDGHYMLEDLII